VGLILLSVARHHVQCLTFRLAALPGVVLLYRHMTDVTTDPQEIQEIVDQLHQGTLVLQRSDQETDRSRVDLHHPHVVHPCHADHPMVDLQAGADLEGLNLAVDHLIADSLFQGV